MNRLENRRKGGVESNGSEKRSLGYDSEGSYRSGFGFGRRVGR